MQYRIGEFSRITGLTVRALRLYHEEGLLEPDLVDDDSGYRYYREDKVPVALLIMKLKDLGFPLVEIRSIVSGLPVGDPQEFLPLFEKRIHEVQREIRKQKDIEKRLHMFLRSEFQNDEESGGSSPITLEQTEGMLILSHRFTGHYQDVGAVFGKLYSLAGRYGIGSPGSLYYDGEYKDGDADIEAFLEVKKSFALKNDFASIRRVEPCESLSLVHTGSYEKLGHSYGALFREMQARGLEMVLPIQERYLKGPGFFFRGNPEKYRTLIRIPVTKREA